MMLPSKTSNRIRQVSQPVSSSDKQTAETIYTKTRIQMFLAMQIRLSVFLRFKTSDRSL